MSAVQFLTCHKILEVFVVCPDFEFEFCFFQVIMNDLFWDLINKGDTATFIDDILVAIDTEEGHDKLVEEVLKRLEENDLFVKPEKCKLKVREVEFLGVVIGPKGVEMQKEQNSNSKSGQTTKTSSIL